MPKERDALGPPLAEANTRFLGPDPPPALTLLNTKFSSCGVARASPTQPPVCSMCICRTEVCTLLQLFSAGGASAPGRRDQSAWFEGMVAGAGLGRCSLPVYAAEGADAGAGPRLWT